MANWQFRLELWTSWLPSCCQCLCSAWSWVYSCSLCLLVACSKKFAVATNFYHFIILGFQQETRQKSGKLATDIQLVSKSSRSTWGKESCWQMQHGASPASRVGVCPWGAATGLCFSSWWVRRGSWRQSFYRWSKANHD